MGPLFQTQGTLNEIYTTNIFTKGKIMPKKEKVKKPKKSDLELRVTQLESFNKKVVMKLIARAHMCRNCIRYDKGVCTETNRSMDQYEECGMFTRQ